MRKIRQKIGSLKKKILNFKGVKKQKGRDPELIKKLIKYPNEPAFSCVRRMTVAEHFGVDPCYGSKKLCPEGKNRSECGKHEKVEGAHLCDPKKISCLKLVKK